MAEDENKSIWKHLWGWAVVGIGATVLLGIGGSVMTGTHPYVADAFFFIGFSLLVVKFWTWEEAKHETTRKSAMLLAGVTLSAMILFAGSCWLSYYLNSPKQSIAQDPASRGAVITTSTPPPSTTPQLSPAPAVTAPTTQPNKPPKQAQVTPPSTLAPEAKNGSNNNSQSMTNSPGGMQAGGNLTVLGQIPQPNRILNPDDVKEAVALLQRAPKGTHIFMLTYPTQAREGGEISKFADEIESVFSQGGWFPYRDRTYFHLGSVSLMGERGSSGGEGIGCSRPLVPTTETALAEQALAILHYPCAHPAVVQWPDVEPQGTPPRNVLYLSVGSRIEPER